LVSKGIKNLFGVFNRGEYKEILPKCQTRYTFITPHQKKNAVKKGKLLRYLKATGIGNKTFTIFVFERKSFGRKRRDQ
jgi:hypothetical protein